MTKEIKRIQVRETERYCESYFEDSLENIISELQSKLDAGWEGIEMGSDQWSHDHEVPYLYKHREETDKEYDKRMKLLEKEKEEKLKAKERKLKQLKKDLASLSDTDRKHLGL